MKTDAINALIDTVNGWLYVYVLVALLVAGGIYFTVRLQFLPTALLKEALRTLAARGGRSSGAMSSFQALINIPVCVYLGKNVYKTLWDYMIQRNSGKEPTFDPEKVLGTSEGMECWMEK